MVKRIPVAAAERFAKEYGLRQIVILAYDGERTHIVTYGATPADCRAAAVAQDWWNGKVLPKAEP